MKTITYEFNLSTIAQRAALLAGVPAEQKQSIQIQATPEAISLASIDASGNATITQSWGLSYDAMPTPASVQAEFVQRTAEIKRELIKRESERSANFALYDAAINDPAVLDKYLRLAATDSYPQHALPGHNDDRMSWDKLHRADYTDQIKTMRGTIAAEKAAAEAAEAAREAAKESAKQAKIETMRTWATSNGSNRLQMMLKMQVGDWQAVAEEEFFAAHTPSGYSQEAYDKSDSCADRRKPTEGELAEFAHLRGLVDASEGILETPRLQYHTIKAHEDEHGDWTEAENYTATDVDVVAPTGRTLTVAKIIS